MAVSIRQLHDVFVGEVTERAVLKFQEVRRLSTNGVVDLLTWTKLRAPEPGGGGPPIPASPKPSDPPRKPRGPAPKPLEKKAK